MFYICKKFIIRCSLSTSLMFLSMSTVGDDDIISPDLVVPMCHYIITNMDGHAFSDFDVMDQCVCVSDYMESNDVTRNELLTDISIHSFRLVDYVFIRPGISTMDQFDHITDVKTHCPIDL